MLERGYAVVTDASGQAVTHAAAVRPGEAVDVRGYAWCTDVNLGEGQPTADFSAGGRSGRLALRRDRVLLSVDGVERLAFDLAALRASLGGPGGRPGQSAPAADLRMASEGDGWRALLLLDQLSWRQDGDSLRGQEVAGQLLLAPPDTGP